jgi:hypothetical protein
VSSLRETLATPAHAPAAGARRLATPRARHALLWLADGLWDAGSSQAPLDPPRCHPDLDAWSAAHRDGSCDLWLSGTLVHEYVRHTMAALVSDATLIAEARGRFVHYHGEAAQAWPLAAWTAQGRQGVSALHGIDLARIAAPLKAHRIHLHAIRPWWSRALAAALGQATSLRAAPVAALMVVERRFVSLLHLHRGALTALTAHWLARPTPQALAELAREHLAARGTALAGAAPTPVAALGHGLEAGAVEGVECLGPLDRAEPAARWVLPPKSLR